MTNTERLYELLEQYAEDKSSAEDLQELADLLKDSSTGPDAKQWLEQQLIAEPVYNDYSEKRLQQVLETIRGTKLEKVEEAREDSLVVPFQKKRAIARWVAAASIAVLIGAGGYLYLNRPTEKPTIIAATTKDIPAPVTNRATITLSNGQKVFLDSAANGRLASQGTTSVVKLEDGKISYTAASPDPASPGPSKGGEKEGGELIEIAYNVLSNPRGSKPIDITLSDGSRVWLNAESSLKYPVVFVGTKRTVEITGEGYFEVVHNNLKPFRVKAGDQTIEDIGTSFNVNAYPDEPISATTLLEGSVKVSRAKTIVTLDPGQQSIAGKTNETLTRKSGVNTQQVMAWKNGLFAFNDADVPTVMRQLARWYDVEVSYNGEIPVRAINGNIGKSLTLDQVLQVLKKLRIHYTIEGKKLTISP